MLGGQVHQYRRYSRVVLLTPLLPIPPLREVKGGWVPNEPGPGQPGFSNKPVFKFRRITIDALTGPEYVYLIRSLEGPSYTPNGGTRDRAVIRLSPVTRITPATDAPILGVFRRGDPQEALWRSLVVSGGGDPAEIISVCETPAWRVLLLPSVPLRTVIPSLLGEALGVRAWGASRFCDPGGPLWDAWLRTRFAGGTWQPDTLDGDETPPAKVTIRAQHEQDVVQAIARSSLPNDLAALDRRTALEVLDAVFVSRAYWPSKHCQKARLEAIREYFQRWGTNKGIVLNAGETPDVLDAAGPMPPERVAGIAWAVNSAKLHHKKKE